ncbi:MAG: hypothetical protein AAF491_03600 [Verrucomicrobiota bacterium]
MDKKEPSKVSAVASCDGVQLKPGHIARQFSKAPLASSVKEENLESFRRSFAEDVASQAERDTLNPKLKIDTEITLAELSLDLLDSYELLRPFGAGNPQPLFMAAAVRVVEAPRVIKEKHLKFRFEQNGTHQEGIYFNSADLDLPRPPWDIAFTIDRNEWRGRVQLSMVLQSVRKSS